VNVLFSLNEWFGELNSFFSNFGRVTFASARSSCVHCVDTAHWTVCVCREEPGRRADLGEEHSRHCLQGLQPAVDERYEYATAALILTGRMVFFFFLLASFYFPSD
jgi:hypothetical protein